ncbi:MAG: hypothetical protein K9I71_05850 [Ignavibacteriales bacterium]|nr:hypothetical protein [Ignavibacteriales bacterium]MCF8315627.1 hypothetical protein [Ignavibacteriales bacterium]MCF8437179.1 hypothetical protein [Ignavibacteriales bacterium]
MNSGQIITTDIKAPDKDLEVLKKHFPHCFDKTGNFQLEWFKNNLTEKEINFSAESYGLEWLGKSYARLLASDPATTLLKADETHNDRPENTNSENLLIKGDNLETLKHLANAYYEKIKMIYIDPPYNTGGDGFVYEDDRKFTVKELQNLIGIDEEKAKRILDFTKQKSNSHSAWLTFMYPRLYIAKQLLKDDGVIFISIDDNEVAQLRLLMDEIFGEENFVGNIAWESKTKSQNTKDSFNKLQPKVEHIMLYAKKEQRRFKLINRGAKEYLLMDDKGNYRNYPLEVMNATGIRGRESMIFEINGILPPKGKQWKLGRDSISDFTKRGDLFVNEGKIILKMRPDDEKTELTEPFWGFLNKEIGTAESAKKELSLVLEKEDHGFETVKPTSLVNRLVFHSSDTSDIILDFFAGSGTTGDAVMQLNAEDGGKRKFILVQLPEIIDPKINKTAYDFVKSELLSKTLKEQKPTIFEITKERLIRAAKKINAELDEKNNNLETQINKLEAEIQTADTQKEIGNLREQINKNLKLKTQNNFKVFETTPIWENYDFEAEQFDSSQTLFDFGKLTESDIKSLLITWKTYDGIELTQELETVVLSAGSIVDNELKIQNSTPGTKNYITYYGNGRLYLMNKGFTTENLKALLEKIDSDKHFEPKSIIAFGYHFESKSLREISENIKTYNNKKKSDIDFITRY